MTGRPLLLIDVDGPLNPYAAKPHQRPEGYVTHRLRPTGHAGKPFRVWLNPAHGPQLLALADETGAELAWCTTWVYDANLMIGPHLGLPNLPVIEFDPVDLHGRGWKWTGVLAYAAGRPLAWLDDDFTFSQAGRGAFEAARSSVPTLLHEVSPRAGIQPSDLAAVSSWLKKEASCRMR